MEMRCFSKLKVIVLVWNENIWVKIDVTKKNSYDHLYNLFLYSWRYSECVRKMFTYFGGTKIENSSI